MFRPFFFFFNDTATTEIYTLSLHDALPICGSTRLASVMVMPNSMLASCTINRMSHCRRSEEHTYELQSPDHLVCRLLLEKKKKKRTYKYKKKKKKKKEQSKKKEK